MWRRLVGSCELKDGSVSRAAPQNCLPVLSLNVLWRRWVGLTSRVPSRASVPYSTIKPHTKLVELSWNVLLDHFGLHRSRYNCPSAISD